MVCGGCVCPYVLFDVCRKECCWFLSLSSSSSSLFLSFSWVIRWSSICFSNISLCCICKFSGVVCVYKLELADETGPEFSVEVRGVTDSVPALVLVIVLLLVDGIIGFSGGKGNWKLGFVCCNASLL